MKKQFKILTALLVVAMAFLLTGCSTNYEKTYALDKDIKGTELTQEEYDEVKKKANEAEEDTDYNKVTLTNVYVSDDSETKTVAAIDASGDNVKVEISVYKDGELANTTWVKDGVVYINNVEKDTKTCYEIGTTEANNQYDINTFVQSLGGLSNIINSFAVSVSAEGVEVVKDNKGNIVVTVDQSSILLGNTKLRIVFENNMLVFVAYKSGTTESSTSINVGKAKISYPSFSSYEEN